MNQIEWAVLANSINQPQAIHRIQRTHRAAHRHFYKLHAADFFPPLTKRSIAAPGRIDGNHFDAPLGQSAGQIEKVAAYAPTGRFGNQAHAPHQRPISSTT
jgi:hypothetical protein